MRTKLLNQLRRSKVIAQWSARMRWWEISRVCKTGKAHLYRTKHTDEALLYILRHNGRRRLARKYDSRLSARPSSFRNNDLQ